MKFIITESKLGDIVKRYLDNKNFILIEEKNSVFFFQNETDIFSEIKLDKNDGYCEMSPGIVNEVSSFFSIHRDWSLYYISEWAGDKLGIKVSEYWAPKDYYRLNMSLSS